MMELDHFDLALLDVLQRFGRATHQQLGEQVPLSPSQIGRRLQRLESTGCDRRLSGRVAARKSSGSA